MHHTEPWWMTEDFFPLAKKNAVGQIMNTLQKGGMSLSKSTIKRNTEGLQQVVDHWHAYGQIRLT